jgi:hypothetical protein
MMPARTSIGGSPNASSGRHKRQTEESPRGLLSFAGKPPGWLGRKWWSMGTNIGGRAATATESNRAALKCRPGRHGRFVHFGHVLPARRHSRRAQAFRYRGQASKRLSSTSWRVRGVACAVRRSETCAPPRCIRGRFDGIRRIWTYRKLPCRYRRKHDWSSSHRRLASSAVGDAGITRRARKMFPPQIEEGPMGSSPLSY